NTTTSNGHSPNLFISFGMTTLIGKVMVANKITAAIFSKSMFYHKKVFDLAFFDIHFGIV
ncbi:hypothetical protein QG079_10130, partial [Kingella kingae]